DMGENVSMVADQVRAEATRRTRHAPDPRPSRIELPRASQVVPILALVLGCALTAASYQASWVHLAYRLPRMHAVIDTTIGLGSLLVAYLSYNRAQALGRQRDYVLVFALGFGGFVNLLAAVI